MTRPPLPDRFSLPPWTDFDWDVGGEGLVAVNLQADADLQRNLLAVLLARRLGNKSIDYTKKKYAGDFVSHRDMDADLKAAWYNQDFAFNRFYETIVERNGERIGIFAFDLAMVRSRATINLLMYSARRGMLVESCLLARSLIEQFAYATSVWDTDDDRVIFGHQPQMKIASLKKIYPGALRAYGHLSRLAHYNPKEHYNFIGDAGGGAVIQRSWKFKIPAIAWLIFILDVKYHVFKAHYEANIAFSEVNIPQICGLNKQIFEDVFEDVDSPSIDLIRRLMGQ